MASGPLANVLLTLRSILTVYETRSTAAYDAALSDRSQPLDSAAALRWASQAMRELSRADCIAVTSASTGSPAKDSFVVTCTPAGVSLKIHSWTPVMPPAVPPHPRPFPRQTGSSGDSAISGVSPIRPLLSTTPCAIA